MRRDDFTLYLVSRYRSNRGTGLSQKAASDAASRVRRLESLLDIDIESLAELQDSREALLSIDDRIAEVPAGKLPPDKTMADLRNAARKYLSFVKWEERKKQAEEWARAAGR